MADFNDDTPDAPEVDEQRADEAAFNDPEAQAEAAEQAEAEAFDLAGWLAGIGRAEAVYPLAGRKIRLRSRTPEWLAEFKAAAKDLDPDESDRQFLAAHIVDEAVTPDVLKALQENRQHDFYDMSMLAIQLDSKPTNQIAPRFLPAASD